MSDFGRRQQIPPDGNLDGVEVSRLQIAAAALHILADRAQSQLDQSAALVARAVEGMRLRLFRGQSGTKAKYEEPQSEIVGFLASCRQIFWALATFSGLSNLLMLT